MCGIAGYFGTRSVAPATVERMLAALRRRGPDAEHAVFWDAGLQRSDAPAPNALLHTRLSIIDPRPLADQPMCNAAGDVWIAYNGEVYDWAAAARELEAAGYAFRTRSDTEFILHAYEHWGSDCLSRLRGMFAIAILDLRRQALFLARDRLGLKPIVYAAREDGFAFGSTVRSLLPWLPPDARRTSHEAVDAYLAHRTIPAPRTIIDGVLRLPPAHWLRHDLRTGETTLGEYWRPEPTAEDWLATFDAAIRMRTVADRPLGLFLSSGIDSSAIACRLAAMGFNRLRSFTAAFPGTAFDESELAGRAAARLGMPHLDVPIPQGVEADFGTIVADLDEPFADPSSVPTWYLARETTRHVKVVLGGDGGDEMFGGYKRYAKHLRTRWRRGLVLPALCCPEGHRRRRLAAARRGAAARLARRVRVAVLRAHARRAGLARAGSDAAAALLAIAPGRRPGRPRDAARDRSPQLPARLHPAQGRPHDHGARPRAARPVPRPPLRRRARRAAAAGTLHRARKAAAGPGDGRAGRPRPLRAEEARLQPAASPAGSHGDLAPRLPGLGQRLAGLTGGLLDARRVDGFAAAWKERPGLGEQLLQLLILDESLAQIAALARLP